MMRSFVIFALAALLAATSVLSAHAGVSLADGMMVDCRECPKDDDCNSSDSEQINCRVMCQLACAASTIVALPVYQQAEVWHVAALDFEVMPEAHVTGLSPSQDIPPPRI